MIRKNLLASMICAAALPACSRDVQPPPPIEHPPLGGELAVWAVDDGHRVAASSGRVPAMTGDDNAVWSPGSPIQLFGSPGETIAFQVVVSSGDAPLEGVTVALDEIGGPPGTIRLDAQQGDRGWSKQSFVVHDLEMRRRSGGEHGHQSIGWRGAAMPPGPRDGGALADALIPIEHAPEWASYPMAVSARTHRAVWIDLTIGSEPGPGTYRGEVVVSDRNRKLGALPIELEVGSVALPYRAVKSMLFFEPETVVERVGPGAIDDVHQVVHAHHLSTIFPIRTAADVDAHAGAITGRLYTEGAGYRGSGAEVPSDIVVIGSYGVLKDPTPERLEQVDAILAALEALGVHDEPGHRDVFLYAIDERCDSDLGSRWRRALDGAASPRLVKLRVGHTCSEAPERQAVDVVMMHAGSYTPEQAARGRERDKHVWVYNGELPRTGAFLTDAWPTSLRANGWIQAHHDVERWFYWESTFWNDSNRGGLGPYDPLRIAETFHNDDGDHCNGDGVLLYPGRQAKDGYLDAGVETVFPSIRLKEWRRGIEDAAYLTLAKRVDPDATARIADALVGQAFRMDGALPWPTSPALWHRARRALFDIVQRGPKFTSDDHASDRGSKKEAVSSGR